MRPGRGSRLGAVLAGLAAVAGTTLAAVPVASAVPVTKASPGDCAGWWKASRNDGSHHTAVPSHSYHGRTLELRAGNINGIAHGWARISGATRTGDHFWLDVEGFGPQPWLRCGPFPVVSPGAQEWSPAARATTLPHVRFRAGALIDGHVIYTGWW